MLVKSGILLTMLLGGVKNEKIGVGWGGWGGGA